MQLLGFIFISENIFIILNISNRNVLWKVLVMTKIPSSSSPSLKKQKWAHARRGGLTGDGQSNRPHPLAPHSPTRVRTRHHSRNRYHKISRSHRNCYFRYIKQIFEINQRSKNGERVDWKRFFGSSHGRKQARVTLL